MALITDAYRKQQSELHATHPEYGTASKHHAGLVAAVIRSSNATALLDYGAGKGRLGQALNDILGNECPPIFHYEPSRPEWAALPEPADMVACIDVLEHIEPECLGDVLQDLRRCVQRVGVFTVHTSPAMKTLPDGRNAHLIQEPPEWWLPKIMELFTLKAFHDMPHGFVVVVGKKETRE